MWLLRAVSHRRSEGQALVKSGQPLPEIGRCVWRVLIGNRPRRAGNPKKATSTILRPIVDEQLFTISSSPQWPAHLETNKVRVPPYGLEGALIIASDFLNGTSFVVECDFIVPALVVLEEPPRHWRPTRSRSDNGTSARRAM